jgi:hypothetical protein
VAFKGSPRAHRLDTKAEVEAAQQAGTLVAGVDNVARCVLLEHATRQLGQLKELEGFPALEETIAKAASLYNSALQLSGVIPCILPPSSSGRLDADGLLRRVSCTGI